MLTIPEDGVGFQEENGDPELYEEPTAAEVDKAQATLEAMELALQPTLSSASSPVTEKRRSSDASRSNSEDEESADESWDDDADGRTLRAIDNLMSDVSVRRPKRRQTICGLPSKGSAKKKDRPRANDDDSLPSEQQQAVISLELQDTTDDRDTTDDLDVAKRLHAKLTSARLSLAEIERHFPKRHTMVATSYIDCIYAAACDSTDRPEDVPASCDQYCNVM